MNGHLALSLAIPILYAAPFLAGAFALLLAHVLHRQILGRRTGIFLPAVLALAALLATAVTAAFAAYIRWGQYVPYPSSATYEMKPFWAQATRGGLLREVALQLALSLALVLVGTVLLRRYRQSRSEPLLLVSSLVLTGSAFLGLLAVGSYSSVAIDWARLG